MSNILLSRPLGALVFTTSVTHARPAHSAIRAFRSIGVLFRVGMPLWALGSILVGVALVLGLDARTALPMTSPGRSVSVLFGVLVTLWTFSNLGLSIKPVTDRILTILRWRAPVEIVESIVVSIIILVTPVHLWTWTRLNEYLKHKNVNNDLFGHAIAIKCASTIPLGRTTTDEHLFQDSTLEFPGCAPTTLNLARERSDSAMIRDFVIGKLRNGKPFFITIHHNIMTRKHRNLKRGN